MRPISRVCVVAAGLFIASCSGSDKNPSEPPPPPPPALAEIRVAPASTEISSLGESVAFTARGYDSQGREMPGLTFAWSSDDASVVTVDNSGNARSVANGTTTIVASSGGKTGSAAVVVKQHPASLQVSPSMDSVLIGSTVKFTASAKDKNGNTVANLSCSWSSGSPSVASVDNTGNVLGLASGIAPITASCATLQASASVMVFAPSSNKVKVWPEDWTMPVSSQIQFRAEFNGVPTTNVNWSVTGGGSISSTGLYTAPSTAVSGVRVTATSRDDPRALVSAPVALVTSASSARIKWFEMYPRVVNISNPDSLVMTVNVEGFPTILKIAAVSDCGNALGDRNFLPVRSFTYAVRLSRDDLLKLPNSWAYPLDIDRKFGAIQLYNGSSRDLYWCPQILSREPRMPDVNVIPLGSNVQRTDYVFNMRYDDTDNRLFMQDANVRLFYSVMPDNFDFLVGVQSVMSLEAAAVGGPYTYSGAPRLKGSVSFMGDYVLSQFGGTMFHELGHTWMVYSNHPLFKGSGHWPIGDIAESLMGFSNVNGGGISLPHLKPLGDGNYQVDCTYLKTTWMNNIELYYFGLLPKDSVGTYFVFNDQTQKNSIACGKTVYGPTTSITLDDIIKYDGERQPVYGQAQKEFRAAYVVMSRGRLLSPTEMAYFTYVAKFFGSPDWEGSFRVATGGRGNLRFDLP